MIYLSLILMLFSGFTTGDSNSISGRVIDAKTSDPVTFAYIHLEEINRTTATDIEGVYQLNNIPKGNYTLTVHRIGYKTKNIPISIGDEDLELDIKLNQSVLSAQAIEVTGQRDGVSGSSLEHASRKVLGSELRRNLGSTLSQTLSSLPGFDQRTNGSAPGRPVIRGLGDERVVILQDGVSSGDVSAQSSDHAVTIDPVSAQEVEVARGPAALAFGANAIGGVINVVRNQIATNVPAKANGTITLNGESVNTGFSGAANVTIPIESFALNLDLNARTALNTQSPKGPIRNSYFNTTNDGVGLSWVRDWGYVGGSLGFYGSNYGIPPNPDGHENGVDIEVSKFQYVLKSEYLMEEHFISTLEAEWSLKNYNHKEFESEEVIGTEFGLVTTDFDINAKHGGFGFITKGSLGISSSFEDYAVSGASTPNSNSYAVGAYIIEETDINNIHLEGGLRFDWVKNSPDEREPNSRIGDIRARSFAALSSSLSAIYSFQNGISVGTTLLHSFRAPSLEELYSEGPHLASYSYEIGNPDLDPERGLAKELFLRYRGNRVNLETAVFHNHFSNYLYAANTGQPNNRFPDLNDYQFTGTEATLYGFEFLSEVQLFQSFVVDFSVNYTIGNQEAVQPDGSTETTPLPQIPPLKLKSGIKYAHKGFEVGGRYNYAAEQDRTAEFETSTDAYHKVDLFTQYRFSTKKLLQTVSLNVNNVFDTEYYNHLSRIKDLRPAPGRNITLLYRLFF